MPSSNRSKPRFPWREKKQGVLELWYDKAFPFEDVLREAFTLALQGNIVTIKGVECVGESTNSISITILRGFNHRYDIMLGFRPGFQRMVPNAIGVNPEQIPVLETLIQKAKEIDEQVRKIRTEILKQISMF